MKNKKNNEELQSRRQFFKQAAKGALPIIAATVLASAPSVVKAASNPSGCYYSVCTGSCEGGCNDSCYGSCKGSCNASCYQGNCQYSCRGGCRSSCVGTCSTGCSSLNYF